MSDDKRFDVFLSHNSQDKPAVEVLARWLEDEADVKPFLDKWHLIPGEPWQEALEEALDDSKTCAVFIGPSGISPWENEEMRSALQTRTSQPDFRVVPVLLPGATMPERGTLPRFLSRLTWVDFRRAAELDDAEALRRLVAGIRGEAPGRADEALPVVSVTGCPYRGLEVFDEEHADFFFGREAMTQHMVEALRVTRFLAVLGPSGSGKSSLVRAGLLPALRAGALPGSRDWTYVVVKPGAHPLQELALGLARVEQPEDALGRMRTLLDSLATDERALHLHGRLALARQPDETRLFVLIDQFEEVFTLCRDEAERLQVIDTLRYAATITGGQTVVVFTMRADLLPRALRHSNLAELLSGHEFLVNPMDEVDLRRVIEEPARLAGLVFEAGLVEMSLKEVGSEPSSLPLLEHALLQLCMWPRADNVMTIRAYQESGGVQGALKKRADAIFDQFSGEQQAITRRIMLRLTQPGEGIEDTRRRAAMRELWTWPDEEPVVKEVIQVLVNARLLTTSIDANNNPQVDVAHEALIRGWPRLREWIDSDRAALRVHRRLTGTTKEWLDNNQEESFLYRGSRLTEAEEWREKNEDLLNEEERAFLEASGALKVGQVRAAKRRRTLFVIATSLVVFSLLLGTALAVWQASVATQERNLAQRETETAKKVTDFLADMFTGWNPLGRERRDTLQLRYVLEEMTTRIDGDLEGQIHVQAKLWDVIGRVHREMGMVEFADSVLRQSLERTVPLLGENSPEVIDTKSRLIPVLLGQGKFDEAVQLAREVLDAYRTLHGQEHRDVALSLDLLGVALMYKGDYDEAEQMSREAVAMLKMLDDANEDLAGRLGNLASILHAKGDFDASELVNREAYAMWVELNGEEDPETIKSLHNLATVIHRKGQYDEAEQLYRKSIDVFKKRLDGGGHPLLAQFLHNLASMLAEKKEYDESERVAREALAIYQETLDEANQDEVIVLNTLAAVLAYKGNYSEAEKLSREAVAALRLLHPNGHNYLAINLETLASILNKRGGYGEAKTLYREALAMWRKLSGEKHPDVAICLNSLASILRANGDYDEAERVYIEAFEIFHVFHEAEGKDHSQMSQTIDGLIKLYTAWGKPEKAAEYERLLSDEH